VDYQALYRKHRPQRFSEIIGQEHITLTLAREVQAGRVAHAYLFAGPRGTGKTTTARIIAKSLNCSDRGPDGEPCNACPSCVGITQSTSLDVIELDAASHNKVEDVREIRANVGTVASAGGAKRVYILDEAHMLSRAASNALLKTLEEPPEHVHFVLATTEPYKLPDTIRSRSQRFDFRPIPSAILQDHLERICRIEDLSFDPAGLGLIVRHARGSVRDALGLLEQVAALNRGKVDPAGVARALGLAPTEAFRTLARSIVDQDAPAALTMVAGVASSGADLRRFVADALGFFRGVFLAQYAPDLEEIVDEPADVLDEWRAEAKRLQPVDVLRAIDLLGEALVDLREGREERLVVELTLLKLARPETATDAASVLSRVDRMEQRLRRIQEQGASPEPGEGVPAAEEDAVSTLHGPPNGGSPTEATADEPAGGDDSDSAASAPEAAGSETTTSAVIDLESVEAMWPALVARVRDDAGPRRHALFRESRPVAVEDGTLLLEVPAHLPFHLAQLQEDDRLNAVVRAVAADLLGSPLDVAYRGADGDGEDTASAAPSEPTRAPDKDTLLEEGEGGVDPAELLREMLGGEVVDE
jgi:DNA polymerase-3 subunit gamma/tau